MPQVRAVVFDAYGTLLDVHSAMARHASRLGANWQAVSADWRQKQIEYTWVRSLIGRAQHRDFWHLTEEALAWAAAKHGITDVAMLADVLQSYRQLEAYPEVQTVLSVLKDEGIARAILSNGEPSMLASAVQSAGISDLLDDLLSVESVGVFKPDPRVYRLATEHFALRPEQITFVSSNPWDVFGGQCFGFQVFWVNRNGQPAEYDLTQTATVLPDLSALPKRVGWSR